MRQKGIQPETGNERHVEIKAANDKGRDRRRGRDGDSDRDNGKYRDKQRARQIQTLLRPVAFKEKNKV